MNDPLAENAALVAELNGEAPLTPSVLAASITPLDVSEAPARDPLAADRFDVTPAPAPAPSLGGADKLHSKAAGGDGYAVRVKGTYTVRSADGKGKVQKLYDLVFNMPYLIHPRTGASALGMIVGKLLNPKLKKVDPAAIHYRTHEVVGAEPLTKTTPAVNHLQFMDRTRIERYIRDNEIPVVASAYPEITELRDVVIEHKLNPDGFDAREAKRMESRADAAELLEMNPDITSVDHGAPQTVAGI